MSQLEGMKNPYAEKLRIKQPIGDDIILQTTNYTLVKSPASDGETGYFIQQKSLARSCRIPDMAAEAFVELREENNEDYQRKQG